MVSAIFRPMEYTTSPFCRTERTLATALALKPPQRDELDARAMMAVGSAGAIPAFSKPSEAVSGAAGAGLVTGAAATVASMRRSWASYGRMASTARCAFRSLAEDTSFIAEVIFSVFFTDEIRPFISFNVGITSWQESQTQRFP